MNILSRFISHETIVFGDKDPPSLIVSWRGGVVVITTAQLRSPKPELRFCAGSNPARGVSEVCDGEDLWQRSRLEIRLHFSSVNHTIKTIHHHHHHHQISHSRKKYTFNKYCKSKNNIQLLQHLRLLRERLNSFISVSKQNYYSRMSTKFTKFHKSSKACWTLLKTFLNNKK